MDRSAGAPARSPFQPGATARVLAASAALIVVPATAPADPPQIVAIDRTGDRVAVTLRHDDTGWDHYADAWRVETADGTILGIRELLHPHVHEQPFTRSLTLDLPAGLEGAVIRARCSVTGWADRVAPLPPG